MYLDFTQKTYKSLLDHLSKANYQFQTFESFSQNPLKGKIAILRHDVDRAPKNGIIMAKLENSMNIQASYYFRVVDESYDEKVMETIVELNHELGYHYEDLALSNGNKENAIETFKSNLKKFRKFYPVSTMCMHGSPMSKFDNRLLWKSYNYKDFGIISEPYFDLNFNQVFYITDASRSWNNEAVTLRDKVPSDFKIKINSSKDIIKLIMENSLPDKIMLSTHPHNWANSFPEWMKIKIWQGIKNQFKRILVNKS
jgi:hypothetical protein